MRWSRQPPIPFITENRSRRPRPRKGRKRKRQGMPSCWPPSKKPYGKPWVLKDKAWGKCLICREVGHWAKDNRTEAACSSQPTYHRWPSQDWSQGATGCGSYVWEFLGWHRGYLLCPDLLLQSLLLPNLYYFECYRKNNYKIFTWTLHYCLGGQIFSQQFLVVPKCPTPLLGRDLSLPSKTCSYCSPDRRCFTTLLGVN